MPATFSHLSCSSPSGEASEIGCELRLQKCDLLSGVHAAEIRQLVEDRGVLVFPGVHLDDKEQEDFARTLGTIASDWDVSGDKSFNRDERLASYQRSSIFFHFDGFGVDVPEFATVLSPRLLANGSKSATEFADCYADQELDDADKLRFDDLQVVHSFETVMRLVTPYPDDCELAEWRAGGPPHKQPLVWHHENGRNSLLLGSSATRIEGIHEAESRQLIDRLNKWTTQPRFVFRYEWQIGDLVIWNNTGLLHRAVPYGVDSKRLMHRTTLAGHEVPR